MIYRIREKEEAKASSMIKKVNKENTQPNFKAGNALPVLEDEEEDEEEDQYGMPPP